MKELQLPVNLIADKQFFTKVVSNKEKIAKTCSENADVIEEFIGFVSSSEDRIKPAGGKDDGAALSASKTITDKEKPIQARSSLSIDPESPHFRQQAGGSTIDDKVFREQFKVEGYQSQIEGVEVPVSVFHPEIVSLET